MSEAPPSGEAGLTAGFAAVPVEPLGTYCFSLDHSGWSNNVAMFRREWWIEALGHGAVLTEGLTSPKGKRQFRRGVYDPDTGTVTTYGPPASHHLRWLASANCLLEIAEDVTEMAAGEQVQLWDLS